MFSSKKPESASTEPRSKQRTAAKATGPSPGLLSRQLATRVASDSASLAGAPAEDRAAYFGVDGRRDALRAGVSEIAGTDVRGVPISSGETGDKRAHTHEARITLSSRATDRDVAHELAHAAQQSSTSGAFIGAGAAERRADAIAAAVLDGVHAPIDPGRVPAAAVLGAGDPYSREGITLPAPPAGMTVKDFQDKLKDAITAGKLTSYSLVGVASGAPEEIFLYNALLLLADSRRWGSEMDLVTAIGATAKGQVTVRFDTAGKAEARLVASSAPTVTTTYTTLKDAVDGLKKTYKLTDVKGEHSRSWSLVELNKVAAAWSRMKGTEPAALEGYELIRTDTLSLAGEPLQGLTTHEDHPDAGDPTKLIHLRQIRFADSVFSDDDKGFIGDAADAAPASFEILLHEPAHAIESKPYDDAHAAEAKTLVDDNKAMKEANSKQHAANTAISTAMKGSFKKTDLTTGQPLLDSVLAAQKSLQAFQNAGDSAAMAKPGVTAKADLAARDKLAGAMAATNGVGKALKPAMAAQDAYLTAINDLVTTHVANEAAQKTTATFMSGANTKRLQAFVTFVNAESIDPPTAYAKKHWPGEPAEFFGEAFTLWRNDPVFFGKYSAKLKKWFDDGNHLK